MITASVIKELNPILTNVSISMYLWFSGVFRRSKMVTLAKNDLITDL